MEIAQLLELVKPLQEFSSAGEGGKGGFGPSQLEAFLISCARNGDLNLRIDHKAGSIAFVDVAFSVGSSQGPGLVMTLDREKRVQPSAGEMVSQRLNGIAGCLYTAILAIEKSEAGVDAAEKEREMEIKQNEKFKTLVAAAHAERKALQVRRAIIARRRELISELSVRKEKEEVSRRAEASRREKDEAARRAVEEMRKRAEERMRKDKEEVDKEEARRLAQELKEKNILKVNVDVSRLPPIFPLVAFLLHPVVFERVTDNLSFYLSSLVVAHTGSRRPQQRQPRPAPGQTDRKREKGSIRATSHPRQAARSHRACLPKGRTAPPRARLSTATS